MAYQLQDIKALIANNVIGRWVPEHTDEGHFYRDVVTGVKVVSVTGKNLLDKPHLIPWAIGLAIQFLMEDDKFLLLKDEKQRKPLMMAAKFIHTGVRDDAGNVGSQAHDAIEVWVQQWIDTGEKPGDVRDILRARGVEDGRAWAAARAGAAVFEKYHCVPVSTEIVVGWKKEGAGTLDMLVMNLDTNELELWDWKTSNQVNDFYAMQVSAYRHFFQKMTGLKIARVRIFKLSKDSDQFKIYDVPYPNKAYAAFRHLSAVYGWTTSPSKKLVEHKNRITL